MILMVQVNHMFLKCFYGNTHAIKHFHDSLNVALMLAPSSNFFCDKCVQFPLTFTE